MSASIVQKCGKQSSVGMRSRFAASGNAIALCGESECDRALRCENAIALCGE
ncbi:MAG: hypothetical protein AB1861_14435 [Cyanobacteriota bacterium]